MLRVLMILSVLISAQATAEVVTYQEPDKEVIAQQKEQVAEAFKEADRMMKDGSLAEFLAKERMKVKELQFRQGGNFQMPEFLEKDRDDRFLAQALAAGKTLQERSGASSQETKFPIVLISFSMPESQIKALIAEAHQIGAAVAVRGLINDDFETTIVKLKQLAEGKDGGVFIDPTMFSRFQVSAAPTFVLPLEPIQPCTENGCSTPAHVKASGSATIRYFLDLVARTGNDREKIEAEGWLASFGS